MIPKFRAWLKREKKMINVTEIVLAENGVRRIQYENKRPTPLQPRTEYSFKDFVLMQSTGLKDCNDKEIYEGDILKVYSRDVSKKEEYLIAVKWDEEAGAYTTKELWGNEEAAKLGWDTTDSYIVTNIGWEIKAGDMLFEIVGNIYENPELLEEVE